MPIYRSRVDNVDLSLKPGDEFDSDVREIDQAVLANLVAQDHLVEVDGTGRVTAQNLAPVSGGADNNVVSEASLPGATQINAPTAQGARTTTTVTRAMPATTAPATGSAAQTSSQSTPANSGGPTGGGRT